MSDKVNILVVTESDDFFSKQVSDAIRQQIGNNYAIQTISTKQISDEPWEDQAALLVFPSQLTNSANTLTDKASDKLSHYVSAGGKILAIGLGAFQLVNTRKLPLGTTQTLQVSEPVQPLALPSIKQSINMFLDSKNAFHFSSDKAISLAETQDNKQVVVAHNIDKGLVILSGSQIECNAEEITNIEPKYVHTLKSSNKDRQSFVRSLLEKFGINIPVFVFIDQGLKIVDSSGVPSLSPIYLTNSNSVVLHQLTETITKQNKDLTFSYSVPKLQFYTSESKNVENPSQEQLPVIISQSLDSSCSFDQNVYSKLLTTNTYGRTLLYAETTTSTQAILTENFMLFRKFVDGLVFTANKQVKGVGRGSNVWVSPEGCLMFSMQISHKDPSTLLFIQYLMGVAIVDSVRAKPGYSDLDIRIKWPNDIYYKNDKKLGGILVSSNYFEGVFSVAIGTGINLNNEKPTTCINKIISDYNAEHNTNLRAISKEEMLSGIINKFEKMYKVFEKQGFSVFEPLYYKYWLHSNQTVQLETEDEGTVKVVIKGLKPSGFLEAGSADFTKTYELYPDGNSFDMLHGLIKKKN